MLETILSWVFLFVGVLNGEPLYIIASGVFAVAVNIYLLRKEKNDA